MNLDYELLNKFFPIISVCIGTVLGALLTFWQTKCAEKRKNKLEYSKSLSTLNSELRILGVEYYLKASKNDELVEVEIKSKLRLLGRLIKKYDQDIKTELKKYHSELYDYITGDGFESPNRNVSKSNAIKISQICGDIENELTRTRLY